MTGWGSESQLGVRHALMAAGVLAIALLGGGCTSVLPARPGYDTETTGSSGTVVLQVAGNEIQVNVVDETGSPVPGITVEAFVLKDSVLVAAGGEDHYPAFRLISAATTRSLGSQEVQPQIAITTITLMVIAAVNIALIAYDYYRNPGEFPVQIPGLIEGDRRVRSVCVQVDANDALSLWSVFSSVKLLYTGVQVLGAPAKLRGVTAMNGGLTWKRVRQEVAKLGRTTVMKLVRDFFGILDSDIINTCRYYYDTGTGEVEMPYMTLDVGRVFAESRNYLYAISPSAAGTDVLIGPIQTSGGARPDVTDIAFDENTGVLWGISFTQLYRIDPLTARATPVGSGLGVGGANALAVDSRGRLFSATTDGSFLTVDTESGRARAVGPYGSGYRSSGDLAFRPDGVLFGAVSSSARQSDVLIRVNPLTGAATEVGDIGYSDVYGLFFVENSLCGVTANSELILIDTARGRGTLIRRLSFSAWGAQSVDLETTLDEGR